GFSLPVFEWYSVLWWLQAGWCVSWRYRVVFMRFGMAGFIGGCGRVFRRWFGLVGRCVRGVAGRSSLGLRGVWGMWMGILRGGRVRSIGRVIGRLGRIRCGGFRGVGDCLARDWFERPECRDACAWC